MALLNKIFSGRKRGSRNNLKYEANLEDSCWRPPPFNKEQIRILLFRECDGRSRKLLFDSASVKKIENSPTRTQSSSNILSQKLRKSSAPCKTSSKPEIANSEGLPEITNNDIVYKYLRPQPDVKMLGEMIFGSVAMSFQGTTTKLHIINTPLQVMFTKVFPAPNPHGHHERGDLVDSLSSSSVDCVYVRQSDCLERLSSSVGSAGKHYESEILDWRGRSYQEMDYTLGLPCPLRSTSSLNSLLSLQGSSPDPHVSMLRHSGSYNSLQRRWLRCRTTSMEFGLPRKWDDRSYGDNNGLSSHKRTKLGMSVIISLGEDNSDDKQFQTFFFSHITLIENYVNKLLREIEKAYQNRNSFVKIIMDAYEALQQSISDLYTTPRLPNPVWLTMMTNHNHHHLICLKFMTELMSLVEQYDVKITKFFVSTLLTAVLSHHLAWVPTITPPGVPSNHPYYEKHTAKWLDMLAKSHPYNPLWVQLGDLYGANGYPCKMAKTVIIGKKADLVKRFLYVLSYFIRCSEVYENLEHKIPHNVLFPEKVSVNSENESVDCKTERHQKVQCDSIPNKMNTYDNVEMNLKNIDESDSLKDNVFEEVSDSSSLNNSSRNSCELCSNYLFIENSKNEETNVMLRPGGKLCEACRKVSRRVNSKSNIRNGRIFDVAVDPLKTWVKSENNEEDSKVIDRDSGISGCDEQQPTDTVDSKMMNSSKVSFTIGDIPLEEICCPQALYLKEKSMAIGSKKYVANSKSQFYVCSCRIHPKHTKNIHSQIENSKHVAENNLKNNKLVKSHSVGKNLSVCNVIDDASLIENLTFSCNSGIQSTEQNSCDISGVVIKNRMLPSKINIEPQKVPKIMYDGDSVNSQWDEVYTHSLENSGELDNGLDPCTNSQGIITDFVGIPDNKFDLLKATRTENDNTKNDDEKAKIEICISSEDLRHEKFPKGTKLNNSVHQPNNDVGNDDEEKEGSVRKSSKQRKLARKNANRRKLCKCNIRPIQPTMCSCRSQSDENLNKSCIPRFKMRLRHKSEAGLAHDFIGGEIKNFFLQALELPLPRSVVKQAVNSSSEYFRGFAWSLVASYSDHYMADFALQGTDESDFGPRLSSDLALAVTNPSVDEPIAEAVCILADTDKWTVQVTSNKTCSADSKIIAGIPVGMSQLIANMTETLLHLWKLKMSPEFCLMHLEDRLQEIYFKSRLLADYLMENSMCNIEEMTATLNLDASDLPLLMAVASTHSPSVTCMYNVPYR